MRSRSHPFFPVLLVFLLSALLLSVAAYALGLFAPYDISFREFLSILRSIHTSPPAFAISPPGPPSEEPDPFYDITLEPFDPLSLDDLREEAYLEKLFCLSYPGEEKNSPYQYQIQGACTDGIYLWIGWSYPTAITRIHLTTHESTTFRYDEGTWQLGHINDMTYNPHTRRLYVVAYKEGDDSTGGDIAVLDPETMQPDKIISLHQNGKIMSVNAIAYDRLNRWFVTGISGTGGRDYAIYNEDFQWKRTISVKRHEDYVLQGIETDGQLIYRSLWSRDDTSHVAVYDYEGNFLQLIHLPLNEKYHEVQDLMYDWNGSWYSNFVDHSKHPGNLVVSYVGFDKQVDYSKVLMFKELLRHFMLN